MRILVIDTIHGGDRIGAAFADAGNTVDIVDVYRGTTPDVEQRAAKTTYDLVVAPVHLDPAHPLISRRKEPVISHHDAVRQLLDDKVPRPMIEITGAQGKTTTAHALAHLLPGPGVLRASTGTYEMPENRLLFKKSITPASVPDAAQKAVSIRGWLVAEESLGVTGAGDLAIITSPEDYPCPGERKVPLKKKWRRHKKAHGCSWQSPYQQENIQILSSWTTSLLFPVQPAHYPWTGEKAHLPARSLPHLDTAYLLPLPGLLP